VNRRRFLQAASGAGAVALAGCSGASKPDSVAIVIDGFEEWSGSLGGDGGQRSVDGRGQNSWSFNEVPTVASVTAQKRTRGGWPLSVSIVADGTVVSESETTAEYGVVSTSETF